MALKINQKLSNALAEIRLPRYRLSSLRTRCGPRDRRFHVSVERGSVRSGGHSGADSEPSRQAHTRHAGAAAFLPMVKRRKGCGPAFEGPRRDRIALASDWR